jgi:hypothetical protein
MEAAIRTISNIGAPSTKPGECLRAAMSSDP